MTDAIHIQDLRVDCIVGIYDAERVTSQPLHVTLRIDADLREAGRSGRIALSCDYARVATEVASLLQFRRYKLLEMAAEELSAMILGVHPVAERVALRIDKPHALATSGAMASVSVERTRADYPGRKEHPRWGQVDVLLETRDAGLYLLHIEGGREIPAHHHETMRELEWLIAGELTQAGRPIEPVAPVCWERGQVHSYTNSTQARATLFCCDTPPFIPDDEILC